MFANPCGRHADGMKGADLGTGALRWCLSVADEAGRRLSERSPHGVAQTGAAWPNVAGLGWLRRYSGAKEPSGSASEAGEVSQSER